MTVVELRKLLENCAPNAEVKLMTEEEGLLGILNVEPRPDDGHIHLIAGY